MKNIRNMLLIGAWGALSLFAGCATNPVTGKTEMHLVPESQEIQIGSQNYAPSRQAEGGLYLVRPEVDAYVRKVGKKVAAMSDRASLPYEFSVLNNSEPNAWALPGGKIAVNRGLLEELGSEAELAAVIGHEIGHVQARHAQERISAELAQQYGLRVIQFLLHLGNVEFADGIAAALGVGMQFGLILPYSRRQELEADRLGIDIMRVASFDPAAAVTLWERMDAMAGERPPGFLSTHPAPGTRIEKIREMLATG